MLDWPTNTPAPDLNIKEVWNIMKRHMRSSHPTSLVELKGLIANTWSNIQVQELESLAASMSKIIAAVSLLKGHKILSVILLLFFLLFLIKKRT